MDKIRKNIVSFKPIMTLICLLFLSACASTDSALPEQSDEQSSQHPASTEQNHLSDPAELSFEGTTFYYGGDAYDVASCSGAVNSILSAVPVSEKIVIECHVGPKSGAYCIFDTVKKSFEATLTGNHLIWHDDDITTAVYSFGPDIYRYDGSVVKSYDLAENEFIYKLAFSDNHTKLSVTIKCDDGETERNDVVDL